MRRPLMAVCMCFVAVMAFLLLCGRFEMTDSFHSSEEGSCLLENLDGKQVTVTGHVYRKDTKYFYLDSVFIQIHAAAQQQFISLTKNLICEYEAGAPKIGSTVQIMGEFEIFHSATNPGEFDAAAYYNSIGICGRLKKITDLEESTDYSMWQEALFSLRQYFRERLYNIFPEKEASIMCAMLLGDKSELDEGIKELYQDNGIIHILSISGLHITIIGMSIYRMLRRVGVPVWVAALMGSIILLTYGIMTGMSVSACRAIGMFLIRMLAEVVGRTYDMLTALAVMAVGMIGVNPLYLKNAGFLLSFGAILGIGVLYPALLREDIVSGVSGDLRRYEEKAWKRIWQQFRVAFRKGLRESMLSGLSVTLVTMPIQLWFYYEVPTYSVLINLFVLPFMTMVMLGGLIAMLVPGLGIVGTVDCIVLSGYEWICEWFEKLPYAMWNPGQPEVWQIVVYYGMLLLILLMECYGKGRVEEKREKSGRVWQTDRRTFRKTKLRKLAAKYGKYVILTLAVIILGINYPQKTTITFLDVGQGDCICIQLSTGEVYLFDCGSSSRSKVGEYVLLPYLKYSGINHIDAVFVSHRDTDHCNGVEELLAYREEWGISIGKVFSGDDIRTGSYWKTENCRFLCLHPSKDRSIEDSNASSQCFYIEMENDFSLLLTGDVEDVGEEMLLAELKRRRIEKVSVLKVAHHGSRYSTSEEFLNQINPRVAVISCGENNSYGHPHTETLERLEAVGSVVLTTPECGAVVVEVEKEMKVRSWVRGVEEP